MRARPLHTALTLSLSGRRRPQANGVPTRLRQAQPERRGFARALALIPLATLTACAEQVASTVEPEAPGFLLGLWHGFIFPAAWVLSLFLDNVAVYAVPNNGGWYDFGFFIGVVFLGVGARGSRTVYRTRVIRR